MLTRIEGLVIGQPGEALITGARVPAGMVWEIDGAGIGTSDNITQPVDYAICLCHQTLVNGSDWFIPLPTTRLSLTFGGTPMAALSPSPFRMYPGQALMARANGLGQFKMDLFYEGVQYPLAWLEQRLQGATTCGTMPDLSTFIVQCQAAGAALAGIQVP